jgi:hypothetical protein
MRAHISRHGIGTEIVVEMSSLELRFLPGNSWADANWHVIGANTTFPAAAVTSIGACGAYFETTVIGGGGDTHGPFIAERVVSGHPHGALCFIFHANEEEFWDGVTVAVSYGRLAIVPSLFDPA